MREWKIQTEAQRGRSLSGRQGTQKRTASPLTFWTAAVELARTWQQSETRHSGGLGIALAALHGSGERQALRELDGALATFLHPEAEPLGSPEAPLRGGKRRKG